MKYKNIPKSYPIKADLCTDPKVKIRGTFPCDYSQQTVEYAVLRFLAHCKQLYQYYANQSCKLRFAKGREARRAMMLQCIAPAFLMELPGVWIRVTIRINRDAITITEIEFSEEIPKRARL